MRKVLAFILFIIIGFSGAVKAETPPTTPFETANEMIMGVFELFLPSAYSSPPVANIVGDSRQATPVEQLKLYCDTIQHPDPKVQAELINLCYKLAPECIEATKQGLTNSQSCVAISALLVPAHQPLTQEICAQHSEHVKPLMASLDEAIKSMQAEVDRSFSILDAMKKEFPPGLTIPKGSPDTYGELLHRTLALKRGLDLLKAKKAELEAMLATCDNPFGYMPAH